MSLDAGYDQWIIKLATRTILIESQACYAE